MAASLVMLAIALNGLSACTKKLERLPAGAVILAFGDSLTFGKGVAAEQAYPAVLARLSGHPVINAGVSGELSAQGRERLPAVLDEVRPELVVLLHGGNDILRNGDMQQAQGNIAAMIELIQARGTPVMLIGVPEKNLFSDSAPFYEALAKRYQLVFEGDLIADLIRSPSKKSDSVHFNQAGYQEMAEQILSQLKSAGAL